MLLIRPIFRLSIPLLVCLTLLFVHQVATAQSAGTDPATTQVVVKLNPLSNVTIATINAAYGTTTIKPLLNSAGIYLLRTPTGVKADTLAKRMARDVRLLYAEPNFVGQAPEGVGRNSWVWGGGDGTPMGTQYAGAMLGLPAAHAINQGAGTVVAVLDRGVQLNHPALAAFWSDVRYDFVDDDSVPNDEANGVDDDGDGVIDNAFGHGMHVAGIIHLVAPAARIMPLRVLDTEARTDIFRLAEAIIYATDHGATVINLSLGSADSSALLLDITQRATARGSIVVAAAGNLNSKKQQYPAGNQCVLAVAALDDQKLKATFSNYGSWVDFIAPGVSIYSALPNSGYGWWNGTSMAAPFVAGQAALLRSAGPSLTLRQTMSLMAGTTQSVDGLNKRFKGKLGFGLPAIDVSLNRLLSGDIPKINKVMSGSCFDPAAPVTTLLNEQVIAATAEEEEDAALDTDLPTEATSEENSSTETQLAPKFFLPLVLN